MTSLAVGVVAAFVFSIPYENGFTIPGVGSLARVLGVAALFVTLASLVHQQRVRLRTPSLFLLAAIAYALWGMSSFFWSIVPSVSLSGGVTLVQLVVMVWILHQLGTTERRRDIFGQAFVLGAYLTILIALVSFFGGSDRDYRDVGGINPNWFSIGAALAIPVAWGLALRASNRVLWWLNALYPAFAIVGVVMAASRGGLITTLVALTVIPLTIPRLGLVRRILVFASLTAVVASVFVFAPRIFPQLGRNLERLQGTVEEIESGTLTGRTTIWRAGLEVLWDAPIVGHGAGGFRYAVEKSLGRIRPAHNAYLSVAVASGLVGLLLFLGAQAVVLAGILANPQRRLELLVVMGTLTVAMMPANLEHTKSVWFLLAWLAAQRPILIDADRWAWDAPNRRVPRIPPSAGPPVRRSLKR